MSSIFRPSVFPRIFLKADWKYLAMLNYEIAPRILQPLVPAHTELDSFKGKTYVSVVGFLFLNTRVLGLPTPFHRNFEEVNLRFYVRYQHAGEWRRGVVFVKEIVPRSAIAFVANKLYRENYVALPMRHRIDFADQDHQRPQAVEYAWRYQSRWNELKVTTRGESHDIENGSEAEFITEHYWGYTRFSPLRTSEYQVHHPRWKVWDVESTELRVDVGAIYGSQFIETLNAKPTSAFLADGSEVSVSRGKTLTK